MSGITDLISAAVAAGASPEQLSAIVSAFNGTSAVTVTVPESAIEAIPEAPKSPTKRTRKSPKSTKSTKGPRVYTWKPWACDRFSIPAKVGGTFTYAGKNGPTSHIVTEVTADGIVKSQRA